MTNTNLIEGLLKRFEDFDLGCCGGDGCPFYVSDKEYQHIKNHDDFIKKFLQREIPKLIEGLIGKEVLHTHNSIPSFTADWDEGCMDCIENKFRQEIKGKLGVKK